MQQRIVKVILPAKQKVPGLELIDANEDIFYWLEESNSVNVVISILADSGQTEKLMDKFERRFGKTDGFKLIVLPVEASIPRKKEEEKPEPKSGEKAKEKKSPRISREELYSDIVDSTKLNSVFVSMAFLSTVVVAIGLLKANVAVIIGAMVIAPFLGPNVALALSSVLAEKKLGLDAMKTLAMGGLIVVILSTCIGLAFTVESDIIEISSRTQLGYADIILALASGAAGVLAFTTGASAAVIGVMVAVALLPPLTVFGLLLGAGDYKLAAGAFLLFITNIICVNLAGIVTFLLQGVSPRTWYAADKAKKATRKSLSIWIATLALLATILYFWSN